MRRIRTLAAVAAAALSIGAGSARAAHIGRPSSATVKPATGAVTALSVVPGDGRADVVIALSGPVKVADFTIEGPDRIVLDLTGARLNPMRAYDKKARGGIRNIRVSQSSPTMVRIVLDLDARRTYAVSQSDGEIRVAVNGGGQFAAWSTSNDRTVLAEAAAPEAPKPQPEAPKPEPAANVATGSLVQSAPVVPPPAAAAPAPAPLSVEEVIVPRAPVRPPQGVPAFGSQQSQSR